MEFLILVRDVGFERYLMIRTTNHMEARRLAFVEAFGREAQRESELMSKTHVLSLIKIPQLRIDQLRREFKMRLGEGY